MRGVRHTTALLAVTAMVILGACSSSTADSTTTAPPTSAGPTATASSGTAATDQVELQMCRTLELLEAAGVTGPAGAFALEAVDLADADGPTRSAYGDLLISAPRSHCSDFIAYADDVAYWLGF